MKIVGKPQIKVKIRVGGVPKFIYVLGFVKEYTFLMRTKIYLRFSILIHAKKCLQKIFLYMQHH